jgi:hypothetical protein
MGDDHATCQAAKDGEAKPKWGPTRATASGLIHIVGMISGRAFLHGLVVEHDAQTMTNRNPFPLLQLRFLSIVPMISNHAIRRFIPG